MNIQLLTVLDGGELNYVKNTESRVAADYLDRQTGRYEFPGRKAAYDISRCLRANPEGRIFSGLRESKSS